MTGVLRADALRLPLADESVDLIVTSPPYFSLRSYRDAGEHYSGQLGSEPTPQAFLESLWAVMHEVWRVLKRTGSCFVNLGDKRSGSGGHNNSGITGGPSQLQGASQRGRSDRIGAPATRRNAPDRYNQAAFGRAKSKMLLPHRFAIGCEDGLADPEGKGWIVRQDNVWQKLNGLPESCTDRTRDAHEYVFHLTKEGRYFSAMDEIRQPHAAKSLTHRGGGESWGNEANPDNNWGDAKVRRIDPLGTLPGSVWPIASEPLRVPDRLGVDHFAAFPAALPLRCIKGWSPAAICTACGEGRRPVSLVDLGRKERQTPRYSPDNNHGGPGSTLGSRGSTATITGYACSCPSPDARTRPSVVLDVFGGTGTTAAVARALGRIGVSVDLSADYCRLAKWRIWESGDGERAVFGARPPRQIQGQADLFGGAA